MQDIAGENRSHLIWEDSEIAEEAVCVEICDATKDGNYINFLQFLKRKKWYLFVIPEGNTGGIEAGSIWRHFFKCYFKSHRIIILIYLDRFSEW